MLKLATSPEPSWLALLPGVRVQVRPITVASILVARNAVGLVFRGEDQEDVDVRADITLTRELVRRGVVAWEGIGDADGEPLPVSPEAIDALLENWHAYDALYVQYVMPALQREAEKNV